MALISSVPVYAWADRGLAFIPITKAACTSVKVALFEARQLPVPENLDTIHGREWPERWTIEALRGADLTVFAIVRNPWDRLWSCYKNQTRPDLVHEIKEAHPRIHAGMSFQQFVHVVACTVDERSNEHLRAQVPQLSCGPVWLPNVLIRFERLSAEWPKLAKRFGLPPLKRANVTAKRPAPWTPRLVELVGQRYRIDCDWFGYRGPSELRGER